MDIFLPSLFSSKEEFNKDHLTALIANSCIDKHIASAVIVAFESVKDYRSKHVVPYALFAQMLHVATYNCIRNEISKHSYAQEVSFGPCVTGNERLFFTYGGYIFIIRKLDASTNQTKQTESILNQEADNHIITIGYTLDDLREKVAEIAFMYIKGKKTIFTHSIPLNSEPALTYQDFDNDQNVERVQPKIKKGVKKEAQ